MGTKLNNFNTQSDPETPDFTASDSTDASGHKVQHVRIDFGADGASDRVGAANPLPVEGTFTPVATTETIAHTFPSLSTTSAQIVAANSNRSSLLIQNNSDTITCWINIGASAVVDQCIRLDPGAEREWRAGAIPTAAVNAKSASGTPTLLIAEGTYV